MTATHIETALARPDGQAESTLPLQLAFMAPRLQGDFFPEGRLEISLWGSGRMANLSLEPWSGPFLYAPNRVLAGDKGLYVAQSAPAVLLRGAKLKSLRPSRRCAWWGALTAPQKVERKGKRRIATTPWGVTLVESRQDGDIVIATGASMTEAERGLSLSSETIIAECNAYVARCDLLPAAPPLMRSMTLQSTHAALSSIRRAEDGSFLGLAAGQAYSAPTRTYFRDGYWTLQALLMLEPQAVRDEIDLLAKGVQPDGEAPSGVILTGPAQGLEWEKYRTTNKTYKEEHLRPTDWWSDHFDSPLFLILCIGDYIDATGDRSPMKDHWQTVETIYRRYRRFDTAGNGLPQKPRTDRDWADNVYRHGYVAYNIGLWIGALDCLVKYGSDCDPALAEEAAKVAEQARASLDDVLLTPQGWYADYGVKGDFVEDHLTLDSLTLLRFNAVSPERAKIVLDHVATLLESRNNSRQPYGDWGVMCAWPPFKRPADTRAKSAFAYRYHNGADWPYLSALYAEQRLKYGLDGWTYPMLRWWQTSLENGWMGSVEYFSPPFARGSLLQGWTGMHAAVILSHRAAIEAAISAGKADL
ncbi:GH116 family glycosyl hydrolase [Allorhizobium sp. BGMRC 0089]|uniref:GH116 family glycosyl hydrolase n=1 Tax=Allorhizobium sonneratiae TaxID=2934936 RepID=UPI002034194E|nr:GH116 family glycosyl hydrolase [Allorhizobium sonneratiae]MCM2293280.1 GH116 family glycosyl hydrolase [Allorhizobium sonneratiae]